MCTYYILPRHVTRHGKCHKAEDPYPLVIILRSTSTFHPRIKHGDPSSKSPAANTFSHESSQEWPLRPLEIRPRAHSHPQAGPRPSQPSCLLRRLDTRQFHSLCSTKEDNFTGLLTAASSTPSHRESASTTFYINICRASRSRFGSLAADEIL
jgi:hypothetical protein